MIKLALVLTFFGLMLTKLMGFSSISWWLVVLPLFLPVLIFLTVLLTGVSVIALLGGKQ